jgi:hypothetical protein
MTSAATSLLKHRYVWVSSRGITIEPCEDEFCEIAASGRTSCGSLACPSCGRGGANLSVTQLLPMAATDSIACGCGYSWEPAEAPRSQVVSKAESAECTCPEFCERDHDRD